mmetsp:Transcript_25694/g.64520  ORF Transcript_25694/g.64520 Transcript_25694/m.64520 type:complete len:275 (+) Transcript_25694:569-1393(+)
MQISCRKRAGEFHSAATWKGTKATPIILKTTTKYPEEPFDPFEPQPLFLVVERLDAVAEADFVVYAVNEQQEIDVGHGERRVRFGRRFNRRHPLMISTLPRLRFIEQVLCKPHFFATAQFSFAQVVFCFLQPKHAPQLDARFTLRARQVFLDGPRFCKIDERRVDDSQIAECQVLAIAFRFRKHISVHGTERVEGLRAHDVLQFLLLCNWSVLLLKVRQSCFHFCLLFLAGFRMFSLLADYQFAQRFLLLLGQLVKRQVQVQVQLPKLLRGDKS